MITANLNYGELVKIPYYDRWKYHFYYSAEDTYRCCFLNTGRYTA